MIVYGTSWRFWKYDILFNMESYIGMSVYLYDFLSDADIISDNFRVIFGRFCYGPRK